MNDNQNIGNWIAIAKIEGKTPQINVDGTFPTNGEEPLFQLTKNEPQGINPSELLLTLAFGTLATPEGKVNVSVHYNEATDSVDRYQTVLVVDENARVIAHIKVTKS